MSAIETRLFNIFKSTNITNLAKVIQETPYIILQVTFKWKTLKQFRSKAVKFALLLTFKLTFFWNF